MRILITGSNGLLGQKIVKLCQERKLAFLATSKGQNRNPDCETANYLSLDICVNEEIEAVFQKFNPTHVIHTAALTNVDYCEENPEDCELVNVNATQYLFENCIAHKAHFQFLSTDFVFDGKKGNYSETDKPNPLSVYGRSKCKAENLLVESSYKNWSIVRTIIVFGDANNLSRSNIVLWAKSALEKGDEIKIINDQFRAPTDANDLAWACLEIAIRKKTGIYHISGPTTFSILELVKKIAKTFDLDSKNIKEISTRSLNQAAARPPKTGFNLQKAHEDLNYQPSTFEESITKLFS